LEQVVQHLIGTRRTRLRFVRTSGWQQLASPDEVVPFTQVDLSAPEIEQNQPLSSSSQTTSQFEPNRGPLLRVAFLT